jgi:ribonuclease HII
LRRLLDGVRDSKQMTALQRRTWVDRVRQLATDFGLGLVTAAEIDQIGPLEGTRVAMERALDSLAVRPAHLVLDHISLPRVLIEQTSITHGDARVLTIASASILAKVWRDEWMDLCDRTYPEYGFAQHKGYGTPEHLAALERLGPCSLHRLSFRSSLYRSSQETLPLPGRETVATTSPDPP